MMVIPNRNIDQLNIFVCVIVDELHFMILIEKKILTFEMKRLTKMK